MVLKGNNEHFDFVLAGNAPLATALAEVLNLDFAHCDEQTIESLRLQV